MVHEEKGQSLTEFALIVPLLLLLLCGVIDFGRILFTYLNLNLVAQESVRLGGLGRGDADIVSFARGQAEVPDSTKLQVAIAPPEASRKSGQYVKVTLTYTLPYMTPLLGSVLPAPVIRTDSTIRVE
ncbi:pilus assembly protein TadE [Gordoniibacillus kamchatkensis]|uniref:Pilus assembly protein TadE n=1 Tax=Gordoniibacillus kamchatkensis TaxID=1590651 RepID=A0ABR5ADA8_9BACL|nr:pilus assembly protein TadE [Paenibacillus sp. VKM B-2647]